MNFSTKDKLSWSNSLIPSHGIFYLAELNAFCQNLLPNEQKAAVFLPK